MTKKPPPADTAPAMLSDSDPGLQNFMRHVYATMSFGLVITGSIAFLVSHMPAVSSFFFSFPMFLVTLFAPVGFAFLGFTPERAAEMEVAKVSFIFAAYSAVMGLSVSCLFWFISHDSVAHMFFVTAAMFFATSYYGEALKRNLGDTLSFFVMAGIGLLLTLLANVILHAPMSHYIFSGLCVLVFTGIAFCENRVLKNAYNQLGRTGGKGSKERLGIACALVFYLTFVGLFQSLFSGAFVNRQPRR
ncbi:MAG: Bax inhibitor-1/YccA family protein [Alphaproteobacteria bacterium]|nr:MAG: Bax inhibitor-1/YccA family protein [Alphaproteobacteria bacterium]